MTDYNLRALQIFEAVYRKGSIKAAAAELGITPSAISHQLKYLRASLGEDLIAHGGRRLVFTPYGEKLAKSLNYAFEQIDQSVRQTNHRSPSVLRLAVCTSIGSGWLIPKLADYPDLDKSGIQVKLHTFQPELGDSVADVFLTTHPVRDGYSFTRICDEELIAVYNPAHITPQGNRRRLITTDLDSNLGGDWFAFSALAGCDSDLSGAVFLGASHYIFATQMAENGLGIALVPEFSAERGLLSGELVRWTNHRMPTGRTYYLNVKYGRRGEPHIKSFIKWVRDVGRTSSAAFLR